MGSGTSVNEGHVLPELPLAALAESHARPCWSVRREAEGSPLCPRVRELCGCSLGPSTVPGPGAGGGAGLGRRVCVPPVADPVQTTVGTPRRDDAAVKSTEETVFCSHRVKAQVGARASPSGPR